VARLEKQIACLERELKDIHTRSNTVRIAPKNGQQSRSHCCRVCAQNFGSSTPHHRHLRDSKHFSPPPSPASCAESVMVIDPNNEAEGSEAFCTPAVPSSSPLLACDPALSSLLPSKLSAPLSFTARLRNIPQAQGAPPNLPVPELPIQLTPATINHTASESEQDDNHKAGPSAPKADWAEMPGDANTFKWQNEAETHRALATEWRDRYNTIQEVVRNILTYRAAEIHPAGRITASLLSRTQICHTPTSLTADTTRKSIGHPQFHRLSSPLVPNRDCFTEPRHGTCGHIGSLIVSNRAVLETRQ
jgi:hypothetical protein